MNYFYAPDAPEKTSLDEEESGHCIRVLRHKEGDLIGLLDGKGGKYQAIIEQADPVHVHFRILKQEINEKPSYSITLAIAPTKNADRMEWLVEKLTEIGVDEIVLFFSMNSERRKFRMDRLEKKLISAMKQSKNVFLPAITPPEKLQKIIKSFTSDQKFIGYVDEANPVLLQKEVKSNSSVTILIGPEGDFTAEEVKLAENAGFKKITLGKNILRTETAGLISCHTVHLINSIS